MHTHEHAHTHTLTHTDIKKPATTALPRLTEQAAEKRAIKSNGATRKVAAASATRKERAQQESQSWRERKREREGRRKRATEWERVKPDQNTAGNISSLPRQLKLASHSTSLSLFSALLFPLFLKPSRLEAQQRFHLLGKCADNLVFPLRLASAPSRAC